MSYIPPHLRGNKPKSATPVSEQSKIIAPYIPPHLRISPPASSSTQHPRLAIRSSSDIIYRFIVLLQAHQHMSSQHVKFTRFEGATYRHLQNFQLYTLTPDLDQPDQQQNSPEIVNQEQILRNPADVIFKAWKEDLKEVLEKFGRFAQAESHDRVLPVILLRFGRILFHDRRGLFHWESSHTPENLERDVEMWRLSKTFGYLTKEEFVFLHKLARKDALHIQSEHKFTIQIEDKMKPGSNLWCTCYVRFEPNDESVNPGMTDDLSEQTNSPKPVMDLIKVMVLPVRHMISDVACVGKSCDVRLAFIVEEYPPLTETELCDLKSCFNDVISNGTAWCFRMHSTSGRFKVVGCTLEIMKVVTSGKLRWYFHSGQNSYQAYVEPIICQELCQRREEWNTEKAILCIEELLQCVWADCII